MFALRKHEQQYRAAVMVAVVFVVVILLRSAALIVLMLFVAEVVSCSLFRARKKVREKFVELGNLSRVFVTSQ